MGLQVEQLEPRLCPALVHAEIVSITMTDSQTASTINAGTRVALQQYLPAEGAVYDIGAGSLIAAVNIAPLPGSVVNQQQIGQEIAGLIQSGVIPAPGNNSNTPTIYSVVLPVGQSDSDLPGGDAGFQSSFVIAGQFVPMTIVYGEPAVGQTVALIGHEVIEDLASYTQPEWSVGLTPGSFTLGSDVADALMWKPQYALDFGGFQFYAIVAPSGLPVMLPGQSNLQLPVSPVLTGQLSPPGTAGPAVSPFVELASLAAEQFDALAYRVLAFLDPKDFAGPAAQAQAELASNPELSTLQGQYAAALGWVAFAHVVGG